MKLTKIVFTILVVLSAFGFSLVQAEAPNAQWAVSVTKSLNSSEVAATATDANGNIYAVGSINGNGEFGFGNSITVSGTYTGTNVLIVKYNANGEAQWAKSVTTGTNASRFTSVVTDANGNIYAAGHIYGTGEFDFGNDVKASGKYNGDNAILVKYDLSGKAQWAKSVTTGLNSSIFNSIATDANGNIYTAGYIVGTNLFGFGNNITASGTYIETNVLIVKYNANGEAQWAKSVTTGINASRFTSVTTDAIGNIYAAGYIFGHGNFNFSSGNISGLSTGENALLVKYNTSGEAQWAKTVTVAYNTSKFTSVTTDTSGNIYTAGYIFGNGEFNFDNDVTASGTYDSGNNALLVKYSTARADEAGIYTPLLTIGLAVVIGTALVAILPYE